MIEKERVALPAEERSRDEISTRMTSNERSDSRTRRINVANKVWRWKGTNKISRVIIDKDRGGNYDLEAPYAVRGAESRILLLRANQAYDHFQRKTWLN